MASSTDDGTPAPPPEDGLPPISHDEADEADEADQSEAADASVTTKGRRRKRKSSPARTAVEWVLVIGGALLVAFLIRTFLLAAFYIPSASMVSTLEEGDRVLVNKLSYKLHDVDRGDIVVFERPPGEPDNGIEDYIKRVIALPGETVEGRDGRVVVNGRYLDEPYLDEGTVTSEFPPEIVAAGKVWVMGDNREVSVDSRFFGRHPHGRHRRTGLRHASGPSATSASSDVPVAPRRSRGRGAYICSARKASTMRSTWSLNTPSMPMRSTLRSSCSCWRSHARVRRPNRWNSVVRPPVQSA